MQIDLKRVDPELNMDRFYSVELTQDLFGDHGVHRQWGRRGTNGRRRFDWYDTELEAQYAMSKLVKEKLARGYLLNATPTCSIELARSVAEEFGLKQKDADKTNGKVAAACQSWRDVAAATRVPQSEVNRMASAFERDDLELALKYS